MTIDIASIFKAIGPAASIIFAAWIFMGFLQTRLDAAVDRYRSLIEEYRNDKTSEARHGNLHEMILDYKRRCDIMNIAGVIGLLSAIVLTIGLIIGEIAMAFSHLQVLQTLCIGATIVGLLLVIAASAIVLYESLIIHRQLKSELLDLPDLARGIGQEPGKLRDEGRIRASSR